MIVKNTFYVKVKSVRMLFDGENESFEFVKEMSILVQNYKISFQAYSFKIFSHLDFRILVSYVQDVHAGAHKKLTLNIQATRAQTMFYVHINFPYYHYS